LINTNKTRRMTAEWPKHISYDIICEDVRAYYSVDGGAVTQRRSMFYQKRLIDIFLCAMSIGRKLKRRKPIEKRNATIPKDSFQENEVWVMVATALSEEIDLDKLEDSRIVVDICEEYANGGIKHLMRIDNRYAEEGHLGFEEEVKKMIGAATD